MRPTQYHAGEDQAFQVNVFTDRTRTVRKDVTGATVMYRLGLARQSLTLLDVEGFIYDAEDGEIGVTLTDAQTSALIPGDYDHQFIVTIGADTQVVLSERVRILPLLPAV